ncbi:MAG: hypothetical protein H7256_01000 [Bdellovibrio sp.]|nr:hypothetical protein [Bdellovibrio sp.]
MKLNSSKIKAVVYFCLCFSLGLSAFFSISEDIAIQRDPASINGKLFQISTLSSSQIRNQLTHTIKIQPTLGGQKTVRLEGFSSALCKTYPTVELQFVADGVAVAGEFPHMNIKAPCEAGQDPSEMASIVLPISRILSEKPRNAEFHFDGFTSKIEFTHASDTWPRTWILKTVLFKSDLGKTKTVHLDKNEDGESIAKSMNDMIVLEF